MLPEVCERKSKACGIYYDVCTICSVALNKRKEDKVQLSSEIHVI
jgi:hypothetical protein